jgi:DNA polymerase III epsilon subunit family exonuclease
METPTTAGAYALNMLSVQAGGLSDCLFVAFDTETTGLNPLASRLVELSGVKFRGTGELVDTFSSLINPQMRIPARVTAVHGITDEMVAGAPTFEEVVPRFFQWLNARGPAGIKQRPLLLAHNAAFDIGFLDIAIAKLGLPTPDNQIIDTLTLSRKVLKDPPNHQLKTLTEHLGVETTAYHRALDDSHHVRQVFLKLASKVENCTLDTLLSMAGKLRFSAGAAAEDRRALLERPVFQCIQEALDNNLSVLIQYSSARYPTRMVTPKTVLFSRGNYYLLAFCQMAEGERTFRLDKITRMQIVSSD